MFHRTPNHKRKHLISPPGKFVRRKGNNGARGADVARVSKDICAELGKPKVHLMRRAVDTIGHAVCRAVCDDVAKVGAAGAEGAEGAEVPHSTLALQQCFFLQLEKDICLLACTLLH